MDVSVTFLCLFFMLLLFRRKGCKNLPPSPASLPLIGHLHVVTGKPLHRALQNLSEKLGPIFYLSLGYRNALVISSPSLVEECFNKNDLVFANRPGLLAGKHLNYNYTTIGSSSYGPHWRNLRRVAAVQLFSASRLNTFLNVRKQEIEMLVKRLYQISGGTCSKVEMKSWLSELSFNIIMRMIAEKRYFGVEVEDIEEAKRFRDVIRGVFEVSGATSLTDFLPFLRWFDFQGTEKRILELHKKKKMESCQQREERTKTMIDVLLSSQESEPEYYSDQLIKGLIMTLLIAGTDTSAVTIEWALSLLLNNPDALKKAREELDSCVGHDRLVDEADCAKLPYLQSIIKETFRLYPAAPLLVPHQSSDDCTIGGYLIPRETMLLVNAWAIHRDPNVWKDPTSFRPERFEGVDDEVFRLIPFGLGRRACPGAGLANKVLSLTLATLIQCFEWERVGEEEVDMTEGTGLTMPKSNPLEAMCRVRKSMLDVVSRL
ncbi:hypothetical protein K2173_012951 [Erythroxylum novogranatense]|uniref:Cytochrome P450 n=1 Tax=Erythroxylum novogranatense TaxID=1862640 RepID=A0AAV8S7E5_9ROSI|nr:hypothetical protein K2173_012951 [Erythroxylum novogranatense]